ncbi:Opi1-domain-containing protein [Testicularia cyperi]|uniref:Opi1-domain-containing protein n=1 Tax=Testicularia cyperi TaxID=1882483 RepID=A0A317XIQ5_9BASI|nr:Opi1-domain-containing protein [Testicularia cyperi]
MDTTNDSALSHDERWTAHREKDDKDAHNLPSAASTPAPTTPATPPADDVGSSQELPSRTDTKASTSTVASSSNGLGIDAEDEDVRIAIMALGAMKSLDGTSHGFANGASNGSTAGPSSLDANKRNSKSPVRTSSAISTSSVASTAISSPSSTPATDLTQDSGADSPAAALLGPARLGDLPSDFKLPAVIQDENGNEVQVDPEMMNDADFLKRVSHLPLVRGTLRAYELGKQRSKVVKYGADLVESSVKTISRPVVSRLGASLGERGVEQLDDFACRQLDRLYPSAVASPTKEEKRSILEEVERKDQQEWQNLGDEEREKRRTAYAALKLEERERTLMARELRQRKGKSRASEGGDEARASALSSGSATSALGRTRSRGDEQNDQDHDNGDGDGDGDEMTGRALDTNGKDRAVTGAATNGALVQAGNGQQQLFRGSRWGSMLVEAGATAGGLSAAMSEESMKSLKYCLQWLQYATAHIEHQITVLRDLIVKLNHGELDMSGTAVQNLTNIKGDVVNTIRGVVDVIGKYAGNALPEPARNSVKAFILSLPARWATVNRSSAASSPSGYFGSSPSSPSFSAAHISGGSPSPSQLAASSRLRSGAGSPREQMQAAATAQAANRILTLAIESLDILRSVTIVFGESLDRADLWVERLRILGLQRKRQHEASPMEMHQIAAGPSGSGSSASASAGAHWVSARGSSMYGRSGSPGGDSDLSYRRDRSGAATASAKQPLSGKTAD